MTKEIVALRENASEILLDAGFTVGSNALSGLELTLNGVINPADIRTKAAEVLSQAGFEHYHLKEVYYYVGAKKPFRTDATGYVEFLPSQDFVRKYKIQFKGEVA